MLWFQKPPINYPAQRHIPFGAIPIQHSEAGHAIALVLPQAKSGDTQRIANLIEHAPEIIKTARVLDLLIQTQAPEISIANALRDMRKAMAGIDLED